MKKQKLNNDTLMPIIGLGTFRSKDEDAYNAVLTALKTGYRHIDTAAVYGNEESVGKAIKDSGVKRKDIFVTTKLWNTEQGYQSAIKACNDSLKKLGLEYVDLYLIHWFKGYENSIDTWKALETLYEMGKVKAIGVSNYNVHHLQHLLDNAKVKPMVNQVETHIRLQNEFLKDFCKNNGIQLEAYAPLMSHHIDELLENETMQEIAKKYKKSVAQIAIKWLTERDIVVIPKSVHSKRIKENFDIFDFSLDDEDMNKIKELNKGEKYFPEFDNVMF
ncbi:MAG: aldo/keto reductase [Tenericutes bacterium]|jgi:diketogulonate reductase-like aldo/keto reductase|nr:aldo/keto reductase [Mycoplasmatota bacterium]